MTTLVLLIGVLLASMSLIGLASPATVMRMVDSLFRTPSGLYVAALMRLVGGTILVLAAPSTRHPSVVWAIGLLSILAAIGLPFIGFRRMRSMIDWWLKASTTVLRLFFLLAVAFGAFLVFVAW